MRRELTYAEMWAHVQQTALQLARTKRGGPRGESDPSQAEWVMIVLPEGLAQARGRPTQSPLSRLGLCGANS